MLKIYSVERVRSRFLTSSMALSWIPRSPEHIPQPSRKAKLAFSRYARQTEVISNLRLDKFQHKSHISFCSSQMFPREMYVSVTLLQEDSVKIVRRVAFES